jgi:hypothetical protein
MKMTTLVKSLAVVALLSSFAPAASAITATEAEHILFIKQEEKLARDVYQAMYARWGHTTFKNIAVSEQQHMDSMDGLITRYGLTDPTPAEPGKFTIPELQALYDELIARGNESLEQALRVGVLIEETDIVDIQEALDATKVTAIRRVLTNLQNGSYNHLSAFNAALAKL